MLEDAPEGEAPADSGSQLAKGHPPAPGCPTLTYMDQSDSVTVAFVGYAGAAATHRVRSYEDDMLALLPTHGARVIYRGHRAQGQDASLPIEVHVLWFPERQALDSFLHDPRRAEISRRHGEVFDSTVVVQVTEA